MFAASIPAIQCDCVISKARIYFCTWKHDFCRTNTFPLILNTPHTKRWNILDLFMTLGHWSGVLNIILVDISCINPISRRLSMIKPYWPPVLMVKPLRIWYASGSPKVLREVDDFLLFELSDDNDSDEAVWLFGATQLPTDQTIRQFWCHFFHVCLWIRIQWMVKHVKNPARLNQGRQNTYLYMSLPLKLRWLAVSIVDFNQYHCIPLLYCYSNCCYDVFSFQQCFVGTLPSWWNLLGGPTRYLVSIQLGLT